MCGRFTLFENKDLLENEFEVDSKYGPMSLGQ